MAKRDYNDLSLDDLIAARRKLAESVNRQMRRMAEAGLIDRPSAYTRYAKTYLNKVGRERFSTAKSAVGGRTEYQQRRAEMAEIAAMEQLRESKTYTKRGYERTRRKAMEGLAKAAGIERGTEEWTRFMDTAADGIVGTDQWKWARDTLGSEAVKAMAKGVARGVATKEEVLQRIEGMRQKEREGKNYSKSTLEEKVSEMGISLDRIEGSPEEYEQLDLFNRRHGGM